jgi:hypothetical protein
MRRMKLLSSFSTGTVWIALRILVRAIIEGRKRRVSIPFVSYVTGRCSAYRLLRRRFLIPALMQDRMLTSTSSRKKIQKEADAMPSGRFYE